jgi:hypothetical protein
MTDDSAEVKAFKKFRDSISWTPNEDELLRLKQLIFKKKEARHYKEYKKKIYFLALVSNAGSFIEKIKLPLGLFFKVQPIKDVVNLVSKLKMDYKSNVRLAISYEYSATNEEEALADTIVGSFDLVYSKPNWKKFLFYSLVIFSRYEF